mgnify:CR=1 FL=1
MKRCLLVGLVLYSKGTVCMYHYRNSAQFVEIPVFRRGLYSGDVI